ncbi:MAG: hypothetical protein EA398_03820 [Deltaproteobacteria bacterium]|nr:MAG: hypothetical protein EA398_03820 [Deltaproteobacteria bacterium]
MRIACRTAPRRRTRHAGRLAPAVLALLLAGGNAACDRGSDRAPLQTPHLDLPEAEQPAEPERILRGRNLLPPTRFATPSDTQREMRTYLDDALAEGRTDDALHVYALLAERPPMSRLRAEAILEWADLLEERGDARRASDLRARLRREAPPLAELEFRAAREAMDRGDLTEAEQAWRTATRLAPDRLDGWVGLAELLVAADRAIEARDIIVRYERVLADYGTRLAQRHPPERKLAWLAALDVELHDPRIWHAVGRALDDPNEEVVLEALRLLRTRADGSALPALEARSLDSLPAPVREAWQETTATIRDRSPGVGRSRGRRR